MIGKGREEMDHERREAPMGSRQKLEWRYLRVKMHMREMEREKGRLRDRVAWLELKLAQQQEKHLLQRGLLRAHLKHQTAELLRQTAIPERLKNRIIVLKVKNLALRERIKELDAFIEPAYEEK